jgi:predicted KAP-like P-loop ATPase
VSRENPFQYISSDSPIQSRNADLLKRGLFAERLAKALLNFKGSDSIILSLEGSWGSGKTSIFNLMKEHIETLGDNGTKPTIITFNPWWFSNKDDLAFKFFEQISANLPASQDEAWQSIFKGMQTIGKVLKHIPSMEIVGGAVESVSDRLVENTSLPKLREELSKSLVDNNINLWIFVDDIDRLFPDEVMQMLSLIRGVGDISNIKYILAYDRIELEKRIGKALQESESKQASNYIDKIVQITFPIPDTAVWHIWQMLVDGLIKILGEEKYLDEVATDFRQLWDLVERLLMTPRDVKRLLNSFNLSFSSAEERLHPIDFLGLEVLRIFFPNIYGELSRGKDLLLGTQGNKYYKREDRTRDANRLIAVVEDEESREIAQSLLEWLFPELKNLRFEHRLFSRNPDEWELQKRICSDSYFEAYFQLTVPPETLSALEVNQLLECLNNEHKLSELLLIKNEEFVPTIGSTRALLLIDELRKHTKRLHDSNILRATLKGLLNVGDAIAKKDASLPRSIIPLDFSNLLSQFIVRIAKELERDSFANILNELFASSPSLHAVLVVFSVVLRRSQSKDGDVSDVLFTQEQSQLFHDTMIDRVSKILSVEEIDTDNPLFIRTLYILQLVTGSFDKSKELVAQLTSTPEGVLTFMRITTTVIHGSTMNERGGMSYRKNRADKKAIEQFTNLVEFVKTLSGVAKASSESQQKEIQEYLDSLNKGELDD